ncbi:hypothetical protein EON67_09270 [archaeon]|nr:MAG: hypothetical protein EON67_09270 [archaeon]
MLCAAYFLHVVHMSTPRDIAAATSAASAAARDVAAARAALQAAQERWVCVCVCVPARARAHAAPSCAARLARCASWHARVTLLLIV